MIFSCVYLLFSGADSRPIHSCHDEQVFRHESEVAVGLHDFNVRESLPISANLILAFDDHRTPVAQDAERLDSGVFVQTDDCLVVLSPMAVGLIVPIIALEWGVAQMGGPSGRMHVGRIQHYAVDGTFGVGEFAAIRTGENIGWQNRVNAGWNASPEYALAVCHVGDRTATFHIQIEYLGEYSVVGGCMRTKDKFIGWGAEIGRAHV